MTRSFKFTLVAIALILEFLFLAFFCNPWPHGEMGDVRFRHQERLTAFFDYHYHPSPTAKATFDEEMRLMHRHEDWKVYLALGLIVVANGAGIYYFLSYGNRKTVA